MRCIFAAICSVSLRKSAATQTTMQASLRVRFRIVVVIRGPCVLGVGSALRASKHSTNEKAAQRGSFGLDIPNVHGPKLRSNPELCVMEKKLIKKNHLRALVVRMPQKRPRDKFGMFQGHLGRSMWKFKFKGQNMLCRVKPIKHSDQTLTLGIRLECVEL